MTTDDIIRLLDLKPHPEGGHFRETFRDATARAGRAASTAIYYLLRAGETSHWHRVDAAEVWHLFAGDPLELSLSIDGAATERAVVRGQLLVLLHRPCRLFPLRTVVQQGVGSRRAAVGTTGEQLTC